MIIKVRGLCGLRIGDMEKDSIVSYGATNILTESMMERGDKYCCL
jgi:DNA-directed RNA polymerase beta subunit